MVNYKKRTPPHNSNSSKCTLCLEETLTLVTSKSQSKLLNKDNEIMGKCGHSDKYLLNYLNNNINRDPRHIPNQNQIKKSTHTHISSNI